MEVSHRTASLGTENAFVVLREVNTLKAKGKEILNFCIGQPDFITPDNIREAAKEAINGGKTGYTPSSGIQELREAVAKYLTKSRGTEFSPNSIVVANGLKPFIQFSVLCCTDNGKGDEVIYPNPGFPIYESQIIAMGAKPVALPLVERKEFSFDLEDLKNKVNKKTKLLILNSPHNPTGGILSKDDLKGVADLANDYCFWIFSDEVYSNLCYDSQFLSISSLPGMKEQTIVADGASKTYAMTGWRMGYVSNEKLAPYFATWMTNTESCPNHITQWAVVEALNGNQKDAEMMKKSFHERRDLIVKLLNEIPGFKCLTPGGAFYAYPSVTEACKIVGAKNSEDFRKKLLYEAGVAVVADIHFGHQNRGDGEHIRFSYASSVEDIKKGMEKTKTWVESYKK